MGRAVNIAALLDRIKRKSGTPGAGGGAWILWCGYRNIKESLNTEVNLIRRKYCTLKYTKMVIKMWKVLGYVWAKTVRTTRGSGLPTDQWTYKLGYKSD
jgi:hypothetical protein